MGSLPLRIMRLLKMSPNVNGSSFLIIIDVRERFSLIYRHYHRMLWVFFHFYRIRIFLKIIEIFLCIWHCFLITSFMTNCSVLGFLLIVKLRFVFFFAFIYLSSSYLFFFQIHLIIRLITNNLETCITTERLGLLWIHTNINRYKHES